MSKAPAREHFLVEPRRRPSGLNGIKVPTGPVSMRLQPVQPGLLAPAFELQLPLSVLEFVQPVLLGRDGQALAMQVVQPGLLQAGVDAGVSGRTPGQRLAVPVHPDQFIAVLPVLLRGGGQGMERSVQPPRLALQQSGEGVVKSMGVGAHGDVFMMA